MEKLIRRLRTESFDLVYSSDSERCRVLAERIRESLGLDVIYSPLFREKNPGSWAGLTKKQLEDLIDGDYLYTRPENGESVYDVSIRAKTALDFILNGPVSRVLLVSHGFFLKMFLGNQLGMNLRDAANMLKFSNCAMSEIETGGIGCRLEYLNNRDFLYR